MSLNVAAMSATRLLAPLMGTWLWLWQGLRANGLVSTLMMVLPLVLVVRSVAEVEV